MAATLPSLLARRFARQQAAQGSSCSVPQGFQWLKSAYIATSSCRSSEGMLWTCPEEKAEQGPRIDLTAQHPPPPHQAPRPSKLLLPSSATPGFESRGFAASLTPGFSSRGISTSRGAERQEQQEGGSLYAKNPLQHAADPTEDREGAEGTPGGSSGAHQKTAVCHSRELRISPRKLNMAARLVRKMHVKDALINMSIRSEKKAAKMVKEAIRSAYFNAINNHDMDGSKLTVVECYVGRGRHLKRLSFHAMGKTGRMEKYRAHLTVKVAEHEGAEPITHVVRPLLERAPTAEPLPKAGMARWTP